MYYISHEFLYILTRSTSCRLSLFLGLSLIRGLAFNSSIKLCFSSLSYRNLFFAFNGDILSEASIGLKVFLATLADSR